VNRRGHPDSGGLVGEAGSGILWQVWFGVWWRGSWFESSDEGGAAGAIDQEGEKSEDYQDGDDDPYDR
jgi:hypothetical protein